MNNSNVMIGSNVYSCHGIPSEDPAYMSVLQDYELLKEYYEKNRYSSRRMLSEEQQEIVKIGLRCVYAKNDPCWGLGKRGSIRCRCIKSECPRIYSCNPGFKPEDEEFWRPDPKEAAKYGDPAKQKLYYLVDLISDQERELYGPEFVTAERQPVIIGYKRDIDSKSGDERRNPIYGYVDDANEEHSFFVYTQSDAEAGQQPESNSVEKEKSDNMPDGQGVVMPTGGQPGFIDSDYDAAELDKFEKTVKEHITGSVKLTELTLAEVSRISDWKGLLIVFNHPAEKAFASNLLLEADIIHNTAPSPDNQVIVCTYDELTEEYLNRNVLVSQNMIDERCRRESLAAWKLLSEKSNLTSLILEHRDYDSVESDGEERWVCGGIFGFTHICLQPKDLIINPNVADGNYRAELVHNEHGEGYTLFNSENSSVIGKASPLFLNILYMMMEQDELSGIPERIENIWFSKTGGDISIRGIGHFKIAGY